jgi:hypothetical protein
VRFCGQKDSVQRIFIRKCFLFTVGSVYRVKRFTTGLRNSLKDVRKSQMMKWRCGIGCDNSQKTPMLRFSMPWQRDQCWWRICPEINVFFQVEYRIFLYFISLCDLFTDSLSYVKDCSRVPQNHKTSVKLIYVFIENTKKIQLKTRRFSTKKYLLLIKIAGGCT